MAIEASEETPGRTTPIDALAIDRLIASIDVLIANQTDAILDHPSFQLLEASWRGLSYLVNVAAEFDLVKIRILAVTWNEVCRDLERASRFDQSVLFQKIYEEEFGVAGGKPFGLLLGDYRVSHTGQSSATINDVEALAGLAKISAAAFAPFVTAAAPELLGLESFESMRSVASIRSSGVVRLSNPRFLNDMRSDKEYDGWRSFRATTDARFVGVVLPDYLLRGHEHSQLPKQRFLGRLSREAPGRRDQLWGSSVYAFGAVVIASYGRSGWFSDMRGTRRDDPGSGLVPTLRSQDGEYTSPNIGEIPPVQLEIDPAQAAALDELGLIPLQRATGTANLLFDSNCSLYDPPPTGSPLARSTQRLSTMLQYVLCVSRFAHYLKVLARDQIGVRADAASCQDGLQRWIRQYTTSDDEASPAMLARTPLREAVVQVRERPGQPGSFICEAQLKPHYQLEQIISSFEIITDIARVST